MNKANLRNRFHHAIGEAPVPPDLENRARTALNRALQAPPPRMQWLPTVVAVVVGVAIIASLLAIGEYRRNQSQPATTPKPTSVVYVQRPSGWQAVDWAGHVHATVGSNRFGLPYQSPDGSRLLTSPQGVWQILDGKGNVLSTPDLSKSRGITWADDSSGICVLNVITEGSPNGGSYELTFYSVTGGVRAIASLTTQKGPNVAACSPTAGRVVVTTASGYKDPATELRNIRFGEVDVIDFNRGTVMFRRSFPLGTRSSEIDAVAVSHDGSMAAISSQTQMTIVNLLDDQVVAGVPRVTPLAFSWDGALLVVAGASNRGAVLSGSTGLPVWTDSGNRVTQGAVADPHGSDVMLFVTSGGLDDLLVVSAGGTSKVIATSVFAAQIAPCASCSAA